MVNEPQTSPLDKPEPTQDETLTVLLNQYQVVASHHTHFMGLIWQVPAITTGIVGAMAAISFGADISLVLRASILLVSAVFIFIMTLSLERYRMFQLRRRKDMEDIEALLVPYGGRRLAWSGDEIVREIRNKEFTPKGVLFYWVEGYELLRGFMYLTLLILLVLFVLTVALIL